MTERVRAFLELDKYRVLDAAAESEVAGVFAENRDTEQLELRVNPYFLEFDCLGEPKLAADRSTRLGEMEYQGTKNIYKLGLKHDRVVWLSPPGGISSYEEGRMVVAKVIGREGGMRLECRGIPLRMSREEIEKSARILLEFGEMHGEWESVEDLRTEAIGVDFYTDDDWYLCLEDAVGMRGVWEAIRQGSDVVRKRELVEAVKEVWQMVRPRTVGREEAVMVGAAFEVEMARRGFGIMAGGDHGASNLSLLTRMTGRVDIVGGKTGIFSQIYRLSEVVAEKLESGGKYYCSACGVEVAGGANSCPKCGFRLTEVKIKALN